VFPSLRRAVLLALALVLTAPAAPALAASSLPVQVVVSPGGISAWLVEDHSNPLLALSVGFHGGSAADPADKVGLAQMVSALLNEGAGDLDSAAYQMAVIRSATEVGFQATDDDFIGTIRTLSAQREAGLDLLRLVLTAPRFDPAPLARVRSRFTAALIAKSGDPGSGLRSAWQQAAYPDHPYGRDSLGTAQTVAAITADDLRRFVADRFARDNLHIGVVGDVTAAELGPLLDRTFGSLPATAAPIAVPDATMSGAGRMIVIERDIPQSIITFGQEGIALDDPDFYAAVAVNHVLGGGGFTARLLTEVRVKRGLAYDISTALLNGRYGALILGSVGTQNARVAETLEILRAEWKRMAEEGPTEQELADAKTFLVGVYPLRFTSTAATAEALVSAQLDGLGTDYVAQRQARIEAVTLADARRVARRLLDPDRLLIAIVGRPEGITSTEPAAPADNAPAGAEPPAVPQSDPQP
jgi:zinc protease